MNEEELQIREIKEEQKAKEKEIEIKEEEYNNSESLHLKIANDIYLKNKETNFEEKTISKSFPVFESTYQEFNELLKSNEFKVYEKKYVVEMMIRQFLDNYKQKEN